MKRYILVLGMSFMLTYETRAGCNNEPCLTWAPGVTDNCGTGCTYTYNDGTVYITPEGDNAKINTGTFVFDFYEDNKLPVKIENIVIDGPIAIGANAMYGSYVISAPQGKALTFTNVEHHGFGDNTTLAGDIIIPADAKFDSLAFHGVQLADGAKIYCSVENCAQKMEEACAYENNEHGFQERCLNAVESIVSDSSKFAQAPQGCSAFNGNGCNSCNNGYSLFSNQCVCPQNHRVNGKNCNRLIYTIDEANRVAGQKNRVSIKYR